MKHLWFLITLPESLTVLLENNLNFEVEEFQSFSVNPQSKAEIRMSNLVKEITFNS